MKTKNFIIFSVSVFATSIFLLVFHSQQPESIQNIVTQTHQHIKDFQPQTFLQDNLKDVAESNLVQEEKYLKLVGLGVEGPAVERWKNVTVPSVVTYGFGNAHAQAVGFLRNVMQRLPYTVFFYDLGLSQYSLSVVSNYCNSTRCIIMGLDLDSFPSHVSDESLHAYRPLLIQHALSRVGGVIFLECDHRYNGTYEQIDEIYKSVAKGSGILAWPKRSAVTSLTHPRMFEYFHTSVDSFIFLQMVDVVKLVVVDSKEVTERIMRPWVQCALTHDCLRPLGAQSGGCRFDKKPQYRYSGCHSHDASALNIVLGLHFNLDDSLYAYPGTTTTLFYNVSSDEARQEYSQLEKNTTSGESETEHNVHVIRTRF